MEKSHGANLITAERLAQVNREGWSPQHDAEHTEGELARAAIVYAGYDIAGEEAGGFLNMIWPWEPEWLKPATRLRNLVKAGALIAAEIDRLLEKDLIALLQEEVANLPENRQRTEEMNQEIVEQFKEMYVQMKREEAEATSARETANIIDAMIVADVHALRDKKDDEDVQA